MQGTLVMSPPHPPTRPTPLPVGLDWPGDHRTPLSQLLHLQPVKQTRRRPLHCQRGDMNLDQVGRRDLNHPDAQWVQGVGARVVWRTETALRFGQNTPTAWGAEIMNSWEGKGSDDSDGEWIPTCLRWVYLGRLRWSCSFYLTSVWGGCGWRRGRFMSRTLQVWSVCGHQLVLHSRIIHF